MTMLTDKSIEIELKCSMPCRIDYTWVSIRVLFVRGGKEQKCVADCLCFFWPHVPAFSAQDAHIEHGMKDFKKNSAWNVTKIVARVKFRNAWIE